MDGAVFVLLMLFSLVMSSYMLDRYSCMVVSQSGFALIFGLIVGFLVVFTGHTDSLHKHMNLSNNLFFDVLLPPIIYEGGFSIKRQAFFRNFPAIMSTAVLGTVIATCVTGGILFLGGKYGIVTKLSWVESFLFGSLISAVDPVATLACFNKLNAPPLLFNLVFGESVLNDAVAIALYQTLSKWKPNIALSAKELFLVAANTGGMFVGSLFVSMIITLFGAFLFNRKIFATLRYFPTYEISLCLIFSLLTYFVADSLHLSGIVALFFSGTMTAHYHFNTISTEAQHSLTHLLHTLAFVCENLVYVFMGTSVVILFTGHADGSGAALRVDDIDWTFIGLTIVSCLVARLFNVFPLLGVSNCLRTPSEKIPVKFMTMIWFAGLRGSIAFALAKNWSYRGFHEHSHRKLIESTTLMVVLFTTIVIGGLTGPFLSLLKLTGIDKEKKDTRNDTDTESVASSPESSDQMSLGRPMSRGSAHYLVSHKTSNIDPQRHDSFSDIRMVETDEEAIMTPRPQFRNVVGERPPTNRGNTSVAQAHRHRSFTGALLEAWEKFDLVYMQPIFGGEEWHSEMTRHI